MAGPVEILTFTPPFLCCSSDRRCAAAYFREKRELLQLLHRTGALRSVLRHIHDLRPRRLRFGRLQLPIRSLRRHAPLLAFSQHTGRPGDLGCRLPGCRRVHGVDNGSLQLRLCTLTGCCRSAYSRCSGGNCRGVDRKCADVVFTDIQCYGDAGPNERRPTLQRTDASAARWYKLDPRSHLLQLHRTFQLSQYDDSDELRQCHCAHELL